MRYELDSYDAKLYYEYATSLAFQGHYPDTATQLHNIGWVVFLVPIFKIIGPHPDSLFLAQRITSVLISTAIIPVSFLFAKRFIREPYVIIIPLLFAIDFRIAQNAGIGITEPLFMLLSILTFSTKNKVIMFVFAGLACLIRFEGIMLIPVLFLLYRRKGMIPFVLIPISIMIILFAINSSVGHDDQMVSKISHEINFIASPSLNIKNDLNYWTDGFMNSIKYMVWAMVPTFALGFYGVSKNKWLIPIVVILSLSGLWAYLDAYDTRYFFPMYPFIAIASALTVERIHKRILARRNN